MAAPRSVDQAIARFDEVVARYDGTSRQSAAAARRRYARNLKSVGKRVANIGVALIALAVATIGFGLFVNPIGWAGLFLVAIATMLILFFFSVWPGEPKRVAYSDQLPTRTLVQQLDHPLGVRALYLGSSTYRIHGTDAPWTIGTEASKGCIRMYNRDVLDLYPRVPVGTKVTVTWERFEGGGYAYADEPRSSRRAYQTRLREMRSRELPRDAVERWAY